MKSIIRVSVVAAVVGMSMGAAQEASACKFLKKLLNRGGDCCQTSCCQPSCCQSSCCQSSCCQSAPSCGCGCSAPANDCGCGAPAASGCGCGAVSSGNVVFQSAVGEPTEASPSDDLQAVPDAPDSDDTAEPAADAVEDAVEAAVDGEA